MSLAIWSDSIVTRRPVVRQPPSRKNSHILPMKYARASPSFSTRLFLRMVNKTKMYEYRKNGRDAGLTVTSTTFKEGRRKRPTRCARAGRRSP